MEEYIDDLVENWAPEPVEPRAVAVTPPPRQPDGYVMVFHFGCGGYGGPWAERIGLSPDDARQLLAGVNTAGDKPRLTRRASTAIGRATYTLVVYGVRGSKTPDEGDLNEAGFRKALGRYRGSSGMNSECYVVRLDADGEPADFGAQDPFMPVYFPRFA